MKLCFSILNLVETILISNSLMGMCIELYTYNPIYTSESENCNSRVETFDRMVTTYPLQSRRHAH